MAIGPSVVERWLDLSTEELRAQVAKLVSSRLPGDHAVWQAIRRHPALVARIRGVLSGLVASAAGSKDEAMQKVWLSAARAALDTQSPPPVKTVRKRTVKEAPADPVEATPEPEPEFDLRQPDQEPRQAPKSIPAMVFQEPS